MTTVLLSRVEQSRRIPRSTVEFLLGFLDFARNDGLDYLMPDQPRGELVIQTIAMPKDTNPNGDIFGGWLTSQMDLGSGILAAKTAQARVVTVAMEGMSFLEPVRVGDTVRCYARVEKIGRTSMTIPVEVWVTRYMTGEERRVTHGVFTLVAVDESGKPIPVKHGSV